MSFEGDYQSDVIIQASAVARGGAIFITDIVAQEATENVASKVFSSDGLVLQSCSSSTDLISVSVLAITGFSSFKPTIMIENQVVDLQQDEDQNVWTGLIDINLNGKSFVEAIHNDGAFHRCLISSEANPVITAAFLKGGYPGQQSELKEDDSFSLQVEGSEPFIKIEVDDFGAAKSEVFTVPESEIASVNISVADRGNSTSVHAVKLRIENSNGTKSDWFLTNSQGTTDGVHQVTLNNSQPIISMQAINYPENQMALKNNEQATLQHEVSNFDTILYSSENGQLNINEATTFQAVKVINRVSGDYNTTVKNLKVVATRTANGSVAEAELVVQIAHAAATLSFLNNEQRLVSGGNNGTVAQRHQLQIQSTQELIGVPQLSVAHGTLEGAATNVGEFDTYEQTILVHDNDEKGTHAAQLITAVNLAGVETRAFDKAAFYTIGGFVRRILSFQEFSNEAALGTSVSDVQKLVATDKDERQMTYVPNLENSELSYTITEPANIPNPMGNRFHWNDEQAVNNNSTGLATIAVEELP